MISSSLRDTAKVNLLNEYDVIAHNENLYIKNCFFGQVDFFIFDGVTVSWQISKFLVVSLLFRVLEFDFFNYRENFFFSCAVHS